jgi:hypothetical protein
MRFSRHSLAGKCFFSSGMAPAMSGLILIVSLALPAFLSSQDKPATSSGSPQIAKAVGVIKSVQGDSIVVSAESGGEITGKLTAATKILRVPPGEKDLKNATTLQVQDLQPGDRVLIRGQGSEDGRTIAALAVIVMKQSDVTARQQQDREDWQKRGVGGLVTKIDGAAGTITISSSSLGASPNPNIAVHVSNKTILRRYAPDSVKFDDAKAAPLDQIKVGDQLRARGTRSADGAELTADEVVTGSFRNIAGTVKSVDAANNTLTVQDAISKSAVVVKVSADSQRKKLPPEMAQRIAMRLKASAGGAGEDQSGSAGSGERPGGAARTASATDAHPAAASQGSRGAGGGRPGGNGPPDFQRMLSRLPNSTLADMQKGDAVMIVSTEGGAADAVTAITLLAGVEPILTAAPSRSASLLSPWSLNAGGAEGEGSQ